MEEKFSTYNSPTMTQSSSFAQHFKFLRKTHKLGQKQIALMLKCKAQSISNWETGLFLPDAERLPMIKKKMRLQEDEFRYLLAAWRLERTRIDDQKLSFIERKDKDRHRYSQTVIPLFREGDTVNPVAVPEAIEWHGLYVRKPLEFGTRLICAFILEDDSMSPRFERGDILFFDLTQIKPKENKPYIVCIKDRVYCRLLSRHVGFKYVFKGVGQEVPPMTVAVEKIDWLYKVILKERLLTSNDASKPFSGSLTKSERIP